MPRKQSLTPKHPRRPARRPDDIALRDLAQRGIDPALVDPRRILAAIAVDESAAPTARVRAAMALIQRPQKQEPPLPKKVRDVEEAEQAGTGGDWQGDLTYRRQ